jgi:hypothetical protein
MSLRFLSLLIARLPRPVARSLRIFEPVLRALLPG